MIPPEGLALDPADVDYADARRPGVDVPAEFAAFCAHDMNAGARKTAAEWRTLWRGWCDSARFGRPRKLTGAEDVARLFNGGPKKSKGEKLDDALHVLKARLARERLDASSDLDAFLPPRNEAADVPPTAHAARRNREADDAEIVAWDAEFIAGLNGAADPPESATDPPGDGDPPF